MIENCSSGIVTSLVAMAIYCVVIYFWIQRKNAINECEILIGQINLNTEMGIHEAIPKFLRFEYLLRRYGLTDVIGIDVNALAIIAYKGSDKYIINWSLNQEKLEERILCSRGESDQIFLDSISINGPALSKSIEKLKILIKERDDFHKSHLTKLMFEEVKYTSPPIIA